MSSMQKAECPYCGDSWEIDLEAPEMSDQDRIELSEHSVAKVVCIDCIDVHLQS